MPPMSTKQVLLAQRQELVQRLRLEYTTEEDLLAAWRDRQVDGK